MTVSQFLQNIHQIPSENILLFDLDGTLFDTNQANNAAYRYAIWKVTNRNYAELDEKVRVTRKDVASLDGIDEDKLSQIVQFKQSSFHYQLMQGNTATFITAEILKRHHAYIPCYIITSADSTRVQMFVTRYNLRNYIRDIIYVDSDDKYKDVASKLGVDASNILLFEDSGQAIDCAMSHGILEKNIICVENDTLRKHIIRRNDYLSHDVRAYFSRYYWGYSKPQNPDFINILKNQFGNNPPTELKDAYMQLAKYLYRDISCIHDIVGFEELTVVAIPRAKAESMYQTNQQLFRNCIQNVVPILRNKKNLSIVDGTQFIIRHTNTKTTHLSKNEIVENDGEMPYVGITKNTCTISDQVAGKDILLIDDIYTAGVNIDEDAIQALYDKGAKSVTFYSVCKTYKKK